MEKGKKTEASTMSDEQLCIFYAVCHVTSMLSACANPVIYGYLNENFNREFKDIFSKLGLSGLRYSCPPMGRMHIITVADSLTKGGCASLGSLHTFH